MDVNDIRRMQGRLAVVVDGIAGRNTWRALFARFGAEPGRAGELALCANVQFGIYGVSDTPIRLAHFMAQLAHESGGFRYMEEIWGPTEAQRGYEGRKDLGNSVPGDGARYKGRGPIQLTGRGNYQSFGRQLGIDFENHPEIVALPSIGLIVALVYWERHGLNALAETDDIEGITRQINGGLNGLTDRKAQLAKAKALLL